MDVQMALVFLGSTMDKVVRFDWSRLIPKFRVDHYKHGVAGVELTMPWKKVGLGVGLGLGRVDLWFGWPRQHENLCTSECEHKQFAPVEN